MIPKIPKELKKIHKIMKYSTRFQRFQKILKDSKRFHKIPKESRRIQKNPEESKRIQKNPITCLHSTTLYLERNLEAKQALKKVHNKICVWGQNFETSVLEATTSIIV